jgi:hypothetical protein
MGMDGTEFIDTGYGHGLGNKGFEHSIDFLWFLVVQHGMSMSISSQGINQMLFQSISSIRETNVDDMHHKREGDTSGLRGV